VPVPIEINFRVTGSGWANLEFEVAGKSFVAEGISYSTDVLGDLLRAAIMVATGAPYASVSFDREPAEWRLIFRSLLDTATGAGPVQIHILEFANCSAAKPDVEGAEVFKADCPALEFSRAILAIADGMKDNFESFTTLDSFSSAHRALRAALDNYKSPMTESSGS
jgi:hypothetical protein